MDLKQLEAFVYVVKFNSFSKAAKYIYLTQPTVSAHIRALEKELGIQLLVRSTKEVHPTKMGMQLFHQAVNILSLRDRAVQSMKRADKDTKGDIRLIASSVPAQYLLPQMIADFHEQYPQVVIHVDQTDSGKIAENMDGCFYDFGISGMKLTSSKYMQTPFYQDSMVFVYPASYDIDHDFTCRNWKAFIKTQPFVMREEGSATLFSLDRYLKMHKLSLVDLQPVAYFSNTQSVLHAVAYGLGISFVSKAAADIYEQKNLVRTIAIDQEEFQRCFYIVQKKDVILSWILENFRKWLIEYAHTHEESRDVLHGRKTISKNIEGKTRYEHNDRNLGGSRN